MNRSRSSSSSSSRSNVLICLMMLLVVKCVTGQTDDDAEKKFTVEDDISGQLSAQVQAFDWANASYAMQLTQDTSSRSNFWSAQANIGALPGELYNQIKNNMNTEVKTSLPLALTVGTMDGNRVGVLNVSLEKVDDSVFKMLLDSPDELLLPSGAKVDGKDLDEVDVHKLHQSAKWIAYHIKCDAAGGKPITQGKTNANSECMVYSEEFVSTALPSYKFFSGLICGGETPLEAFKQECNYWSESEEKREMYGSACIQDQSNSLKPGSRQAKKDGMDIYVTDSEVANKIKITEGESPEMPKQVDTTSTSKRETINTAYNPNGQKVEVKVYSQNIYDSYMKFDSFKEIDGAEAKAAINIC